MKKTASKFGALLASIAMVLVAVGALTTASYAWFTNSLTATVSEMTIQASTSKALLISSAASGTFGTQVTEETLWGVTGNIVSRLKGSDPNDAYGDAATRKLTSVTPQNIATNVIKDYLTTSGSTKGVIPFLKLKDSFIPSADGAWTAASAYDTQPVVAADTEIAGYMQFDLFFKANFATETNHTYDIALDLTSNDGTTYSGTKIIDQNGGEISKSVRYAFISNKTFVTAAAGPKTINIGNTGDDNSVVVWAPASETDATTTQAFIDTSKAYTKTPLSKNSNLSNVKTGKYAQTGEETDVKLITGITTDVVYQIRVMIWIEGNDKDCVNEVSIDMLKSSLAFTLVDNAPVSGG